MNLALFDFDGTITEKDSFQDFMEFVGSIHKSHIFKFYLFLPIIIGHGLGIISMGRFEELLFTKFGSRLKAGTALLNLKSRVNANKAKLKSGEISMDQIYKAVADSMNSDFLLILAYDKNRIRVFIETIKLSIAE